MPQLKQLDNGFPPWQPGFNPESGHLGLGVSKVPLGHVTWVSLENHSDRSTLIIIYNPGLVQYTKYWLMYQVDLVSPISKIK
jgi:hypothetical protein